MGDPFFGAHEPPPLLTLSSSLDILSCLLRMRMIRQHILPVLRQLLNRKNATRGLLSYEFFEVYVLFFLLPVTTQLYVSIFFFSLGRRPPRQSPGLPRVLYHLDPFGYFLTGVVILIFSSTSLRW